MTIKIYNSLNREKEIFEPIDQGKVKMYVCGPTVYDYIHIGNARTFIFYDVVRRYLELVGYDVQYVMNFTDIDDKIIQRANELSSSAKEIAENYIEKFFADMDRLGVRRATIHPKVTENIDEIIVFIKQLIEKGYAYESGGDVYYRTSRFADYGKLSHQNMEELQFGIRVEVGERKEAPQDFVLWKSAKENEPAWESPWSAGRPGWHIECSTLVKKYLGETIDIHGGGQDLQFPHHECEIAQSEALHDQELARYWMHSGFIQFDNEKMSKSLGNVFNIPELSSRFSKEALRYMILSTHYRNPLNFSEDVVGQMEHAVQRIQSSYESLHFRLENAGDEEKETAVAVGEKIQQITQRFHERMKDDFNTADAITSLFDLTSEANIYMKNERLDRETVERFIESMDMMNGVLGIIADRQESLLDQEVDRLIAERVAAREAKNWARADEIRDQLAEEGIVLEDTPQGIRWRRK